MLHLIKLLFFAAKSSTKQVDIVPNEAYASVLPHEDNTGVNLYEEVGPPVKVDLQVNKCYGYLGQL